MQRLRKQMDNNKEEMMNMERRVAELKEVIFSLWKISADSLKFDRNMKVLNKNPNVRRINMTLQSLIETAMSIC